MGTGRFWSLLAILLFSARIASATLSQQIVQQFFVPFPETDFQASLQGITSDSVGTQMQTIVSIVVGTTNTIVVYDHWEDGYENDLSNPTQPNTQVWGDGILTNGVAPGYTNDTLPPGAVITLTNIVSLPRNPSTIRYDGCDRIGATRPVTVSRAGWSTTIGTLLASATEVYDTSRYGTSFTVPVGTNTTPAVENFSYSSLHIIAAQNGTVVTIDRNGDGVIDQTNTLNMGESVFVNGKILAGARVLATKPVQVHELTGRIGSSYQSRTFAIRPVEQWDSNYYAPVGTTTANNTHNVFVFNQYATNLTVLYSTRTSSGSFSVPGKGNYKFTMPLNSGARFYTTNGLTFYAVGCNDSGSSSTGNNQNFDWGYALLPAAALTPVVIVGWAPGSDDQSSPAGPDQNGSPVWVTPTKATTIYVNYAGDYNVGPQVAPNGHRYNTNYTLAAYQFQTIFNPTTKNMTGARIFTADGTTFAAAWGEDASVSSQGAPYLDAGTGIIPFPVPNIAKSSLLAVDQDGNGKLSWGDTLEYTIRVQNDGMLVLGNVLVLDALPSSLKYVTNSTTVNGTPVADNLVPPAATAFPLDEAGLILPQIQVNGFSEIKYRVTVAPGATSISNSVLASAGGTIGSGDDTVQSSESVVAAPPVVIDFTDASGNPVSAYLINSGIFVTLNDLARNTNSTSLQTVSVTVTNTSNGDRETVTLTETGTNTGVFRNTTALPSSISSGSGVTNGTLLALAGHTLTVAYTDPVTANSDSATAAVAAAPLPSVSKTSQLVADLNGDGRIGWGDTISYTIVLTNASAFTISNLVVLDLLPTNAAYINNSTTSNAAPVADAGSTTFPLDESGFQISTLPSGTSKALSFQATVIGGISISNSVTVSNAFGQVQAQNVAAVVPPPPTCNLTFADASGNPISLVQENAGIFATLTDTSRNTDAATAQTVTVTITNISNGDVESLALTETGNNTGIFRNATPLSTTTASGSSGDGSLNSHNGNLVSVQYAGPSSEVCSAVATVIPAIQTKKLYLSADNSVDQYQNLDRIDPVAAGKTSTSNSVVLANGSTTTFAQTPSFCSEFFMPMGSLVAITNYYQVTTGSMPANPAISATLKKGTNAATATTILVLNNPTVSGGALKWSAALPASVSVANGESLFLEIASAQSGVTFTLQYNSAAKPSVVALPTTTVITLDQVGVYDAPFPSGNLITNAASGQTVFLRASASDPFGAYDVTTMSLAVVNPGGFTATTNLSSAYVVASNSCSKTFEYAWTAENWQGSYTIRATAFEGTEGITNSAQTSLQVAYQAGGTPSTVTFIDSTGTQTNSYATNQTICVRVTHLNRNLNPGTVENVTAVITTTSGDSETVTLTETGTNTGIFSGCINANTSNANTGNGVLNAAGGSGLTVTYTDPFNPGDTASDTAIVRTPPGPRPTVSLFKTLVAPANGNVLLGNTVQFDITIGNPGSITVTNVKVTDTFPSSRLQFVSATLPPDNAAPAGTLTWNNIGPLASGQSVTISTYFTATAAGKLTNSVSVTGTTNVGPAVAVAANTAPAMSVVKTLVSPNPGPAYINDTAIFRIAITNIGSTTVSSYILQDQFSSACFQFLGASVAPSGSGGGLVLWTGLPSLAAGASTVIFVTNKVTGTCSPALNTAAISSAVDQSGTAISPVQSVASVMNVGATASGTVWYDSNVNATNDAGDSALSDVIVYADLNGDGIRQGSEPFATTDTNGFYQITSLPAGNYSARVDTNSLIDGLRPTFDVDGTNSPHRVSVTVTNGQSIAGLNFGYVGSGNISGYLWNDLNGEGVRQSGEPFLSGIVTFIDYNANGARDASEPHVTTDASGHYAFTNLVAASYRVAVDIPSLPSGLRATYDADGTNTLHVATIALAANQNVTNANFGYQGAASLSGIVTDATTGDPIPGATVVVVDSLGAMQTVMSDVTGHFIVPALWTGPASVTASRPGYSTAAYSPTISQGVNTQNGALVANILSGTIRDAATLLPLAGATVVVVDSASVTNTIVTSASGTYAVTNIAAGTAAVTASKSGYTTASAAPLIVSGSNTQDLAMTANSLTGKVTDYFTGLPIAAAQVSVTDSSNVVHGVTTDSTGNYTVSTLSVGPATITFGKTGYAAETESTTIVSGANIQNAILVPNILSGVVRDSITILPIEGATVIVIDNSGVTNVISTGADGGYNVTNIATGVATVTAFKGGYTTASAIPNIVIGTNSQDLSLIANSLAGRVTNTLTGSPINGVVVSVTDSSNVVHTATTDTNGNYSVSTLPTGPVTVAAAKVGYGSSTANSTINSGVNTQDLALTPNVLTGVIRDSATTLPIAGATVTVVDSGNTTNVISTPADGSYAVTNIAVGNASVTASKTGYVSAAASPEILAGTNNQDLALTPNSLSGLVTDSFTGQPISGATVLVTDNQNVVQTLATDASGNYSVSALPLGSATVQVSKIGYSSETFSPTIVAGLNTQDAALTPNVLTGVIRDAYNSEPIAGAAVTVVDAANVTSTFITGPDGGYAVTNIATGNASVTATKAGYGSASATPTIVVGPNHQDLNLTPVVVGGFITDSLSAQPIANASITVTDSSNTVHTALTDTMGHYAIYNLPIGQATVAASKAGYSSASASLSLVPGYNVQDETLTPTTLNGEVTDRGSHEGISGVTVLVVDAAGTTNYVTTDLNGRYGVTNLAAGAATVLAGKDGFTSTNAAPVIVLGANVQDLEIAAENPTLAVISSINAYSSNQFTVVRWQTASEVGTVSYDLLRQTGSGWTRVNSEPVMAANGIAGASYDVVDTTAQGSTPAQYQIVEYEEQGTKRVYGPFTLQALSPLPSLVAESTMAAKNSLAKTAATPGTGAKPLVTGSTPAAAYAKIAVTNTGIQVVSATAVAAVLGAPVGTVQQQLLAGQYQLSNLGRPVTYIPNADGSTFSFYAVALKNNYTDKNAYLLKRGSNASLPVANGPDAPSAPVSDISYQATLDLEQDLLAVPTLALEPAQDFWMWQRLVAGLTMFDTANISFVLDHVSASGSSTNRLHLELLGGSETTHTIQVTLNGAILGQDTWDGRAAHGTTVDVPPALLVSGTNRLSIKAVKKTSTITSQWYLNSVNVRYAREYIARNGVLAFGANSNAAVTITGFGAPSVTLMDVSDPSAPALVNNTLITPNGDSYSMSFAPSTPNGQFIAFDAASGNAPASVTGANAESLRSNKNGAEYLLITTSTLAPGATNLAAYRQQKGLQSMVVTVEDIYNEFGYGIASPDAIKSFLATALHHWPVKPRYVIFVGDGTYDYRDILQKHDNLVPPALVETAYGLFCSDTAYADIDGNGVPQLAIGRLPVKTLEQLAAVIAKIQAYEAALPSQNAQALLVSDVPDSAGNFTDAIQEVNSTLSGTYSNALLKCAAGDNADTIRKSIQSNLSTGVDLFNYIGHGAIDRFGNSGYVTTADVSGLKNTNRLPVVVAVTCVAGQYSQPGADSLAENLTLKTGGGAIAVIAPTGLSVNQDASRLNLRLMQLLRVNSGPALGDMFRQALADHVTIDYPDTDPAIYNLIGDPALTYNVTPKLLPLAPQFTSIVKSNGNLVVTWTGGKPPYQLEKRGTAAADGKWDNIGTVTGNSAVVPMDGPIGLIRIRCDQ